MPQDLAMGILLFLIHFKDLLLFLRFGEVDMYADDSCNSYLSDSVLRSPYELAGEQRVIGECSEKQRAFRVCFVGSRSRPERIGPSENQEVAVNKGYEPISNMKHAKY